MPAPKRVSTRGKAAKPPATAPAPSNVAPAPKKRTPKKPSQYLYVRNIRGTICRFTLMDNTRIELQPRGMRGDTFPVSLDHEDDPILRANVGMLFEVLNEADGKEVIFKQATNQQHHTAFDQLVNEHGQKISSGRITPSAESQAKTLGEIQANADRLNDLSPQQAQVPGSVGYPGVDIPSHLSAEEAADYVARQMKGAEDAAGDVLRQGLNVSIDAPRQS